MDEYEELYFRWNVRLKILTDENEEYKDYIPYVDAQINTLRECMSELLVAMSK